MTFSASWSGKGRDFPGLPGLVSPPISTLSDREAEHVSHVGHIVEHFLDEHREYDASVSVGGSAGDDGKLGVNLNIALAPHAAAPETAQVPEASPTDPAATASSGDPTPAAPDAESATPAPSEGGQPAETPAPAAEAAPSATATAAEQQPTPAATA